MPQFRTNFTCGMNVSFDTIIPPYPFSFVTAMCGNVARRGEENVSVIVAPIMAGFSLDSLGGPRDAAERFLASLAPPSSGLEVRERARVWGHMCQGNVCLRK